MYSGLDSRAFWGFVCCHVLQMDMFIFVASLDLHHLYFCWLQIQARTCSFHSWTPQRTYQNLPEAGVNLLKSCLADCWCLPRHILQTQMRFAVHRVHWKAAACMSGLVVGVHNKTKVQKALKCYCAALQVMFLAITGAPGLRAARRCAQQ